jgi:hypothetical protein
METTPAGGRRQRAEFFPALERHSRKVQADFSIRSCSSKKPERREFFPLQRGAPQLAHCPWLTKA